MADKTPTVPEDPKTLPRLPIDLETYNVRNLKAITGDQLWFASLLIELREMSRKLDELIARTKA